MLFPQDTSEGFVLLDLPIKFYFLSQAKINFLLYSIYIGEQLVFIGFFYIFDLVFRKGEFIDYIIDGDTKLVLYALFKFFVEIEYEVKENKIVGKDSFVDGEKLDRHSKF